MRALIVLCFFALLGCSEENNPSITSWRGSSCAEEVGHFNECPDEVVCQLFYVTIPVEIIDRDGNPVIFQETTLTNLNTGEFLETEADFPPENGYIIAEDSMFDQVQREGDCVQLSGYIAGNLVFQHAFLVGHDCCHVELLAGPRSFTL